MFNKAKTLSSLIILLLVGCAKVQLPQENLKFEVRGVAAITAKGQSHRAQFLWREYPKHFEITLFGPLNVGTIQIEGNPKWIKLTTPKGKILTSNNPDKLVERILKSPLPIQGLFYWLQGKADLNRPSQIGQDPLTKVRVLKQDGWSIYYTRLYPDQKPHHILLKQADISIKMVLKDWKVKKG